MGQQRQAHRPSNKTPRRRRERPGRATRQGNRLQNAQGCESHQGAWSPTSRRERKEDDLGPQTHERWKEIGPRECQEKRKNPAGWPMNFIQVRRTPDQMLRIITKSPRDKEELYKTHKRAKALNAILEFQASITPSFQEYTCFLSLSFTTAKIDSSSKLHYESWGLNSNSLLAKSFNSSE